ncbi:MAG: hypothetical protein C0506_13410 [Anaerolinea sp.]|nr:hypothetical protein [Anaerolinea sp.]
MGGFWLSATPVSAVLSGTKMSYLRAVLKESEIEEAPERAPRPVAVVSSGVAEVVYVDDDATAATITAALQAWGLRVRAEREHLYSGTRGLESDAAWTTTRPHWPPISRLLNILSPVWLPTFEKDRPGDDSPPLTWFQRAA